MKKAKKIALIIAITIICIAISAFGIISIVNSKYDGDPYNSSEMLQQNELGQLTLNYNGANSMPESEIIAYKANEAIQLPTLEKDGYHFIGWSKDGEFYFNTASFSAKSITLNAWFEADYSSIKSNAAIITDNNTYEITDENPYFSTEVKDATVYVKPGYTVIINDEIEFLGKETKYSSTKKYSGKIESIKVVENNSDVITTGKLTDELKHQLLNTFAPRIWWAEGEEYFATSVEDVFENQKRVNTPYGYKAIIQELDKPSFKNTYLLGNMNKAKVYAFATEKQENLIDLSYFIYTPYNLGKTVLGMEFGNHIGDWEHITVRILKEGAGNNTTYRPIVCCFSAHNFDNTYAWNEIELIDDTHPVAYTALGSHGMWYNEGNHVYVNAIVLKLTDDCSKGTVWDTWTSNYLETYSYDCVNHTGYGIGNSQWNTCFDLDASKSDSNSVIRWGNNGWRPPICITSSLNGGPSGPQHKSALASEYTLN